MTLAGCIIYNENGQLLLIHRNTPKRVQWEIPGGTVEDGETPEQAAVREGQEELGCKVTIGQQVGSKSFQEEGKEYHFHWFEATLLPGETIQLQQASEEEPDHYDDMGFFSLDELQGMMDQLSSNTRNYLAHIGQ